jgi:SP family general alpha glucoside:H+ symporter-like MFS transporter
LPPKKKEINFGDFWLIFSAASQSILKQITKAGQLVGLGATGWVVDRIGYKWTMLGALVGIVPIVFMQFFAPNKEVLIAAQFLIGIPLAPFLTLSNVSLR